MSVAIEPNERVVIKHRPEDVLNVSTTSSCGVVLTTFHVKILMLNGAP